MRSPWLCAVISVLVAITTFFVATWMTWLIFVGAAIVFVLAVIGLTFTITYEIAKTADKDFEQRFPSYVVYLE